MLVAPCSPIFIAEVGPTIIAEVGQCVPITKAVNGTVYTNNYNSDSSSG
jgi:hypothetical protein